MLAAIWRWLSADTTQTNPSADDEPSIYHPMNKYFVFNETGNIMLCATDDSMHSFEQDSKDAFMDVTVFFSAMTKALHDTVNPVTKARYSIYNYEAVKSILHASGMFIETNYEEGVFSTKAVGETLGKALIEKILNRKLTGSRLGFSRSMFNGMYYQNASRDELAELTEEQRRLCRGGSIFFVCELLKGLPQTSAILTHISPFSGSIDEQASTANEITMVDDDEHAQDIFALGSKEEKLHTSKGIERTWKFKKRTFLFVPPKFLAKHAGSLNESLTEDYQALIRTMASGLEELSQKANKT